MATKLLKPITREVIVKPEWQKRGTYIVSLVPSSEAMIKFKEKGKRTAVYVTLRSVLDTALRIAAASEKSAKWAEYEAKKETGLYKGLRKPQGYIAKPTVKRKKASK